MKEQQGFTYFSYLGMPETSIKKGGSKWVQGPDGLGTLINILEHVYKWKTGYKLPKSTLIINNMAKTLIFGFNSGLKFQK